MRYEFALFADYFQILLRDDGADGDLAACWDDAAVARMITAAPGLVGIGTARNTTVPVVVDVLAADPGPPASDHAHVAEASLHVASGRLVVAGCTDYLPDAARIALPSGDYRVRLCASGLDTLSDDGLAGDDRYLVQLWPAPLAGPVCLRRHPA
ncbi:MULTISPECIES: hypothetical protein [Luteimonas]|uniref:hypothetical protein n=1 Tax=Luteimonas TaxID=83614 RepID=UPI000C7A5905|nr:MULTISPECIES: hypothetical protein [Luteimonas]